MITVPFMATVADLQRRYRALVDRVKRTGEPMIVVNNGKPEVIVMDARTYEEHAQRLQELEEEYLLRVAKEGLEEYKKGKTLKLKKGQKLLALLK